MTALDIIAPDGRRRWWRRALVVTAALVLILELVLRLAAGQLGEPLQWYSRSAQNKAELLRGDADRASVVFVGSSAVMASLDPHRFATSDTCQRTAFNAGIAGAVPSMSADWLDHVVVPAVHPDVVVLGISPRDLSKSSTSASSAYFGAVAVRDDLGAKADRWFGRWSYLVRYRGLLRDPVQAKGRIDELRGVAGDDWTFDDQGFAARSAATGTDSTVQTNDPGMVIDDDQVRVLGRLVTDLQEQGRTPVLAAMGTSSRWRSTPRGDSLADDAFAALEQIAADRGAQFVDLTSIDAPTQFVDLVHTNRTGSLAETDLLASQLAAVRTGCPS